MPLHESLLFLLGIWSSIWFLLLIISEDANISLSIFILCACKRWKMWTTCLNIVLKGFLSFYLLFIFYLGFFLLLLSLGFICCIMGDAGACSRSFIVIVGVWLLQLFFGWFGQKSNGTLREVMYTMEDFAEIVRVILLALFIQCVHTIIHGSYRLCWRILSFSMNWLVLLYHVHQEVNNVADWWTKNGVNQLSITFYVWFCIPLQFYLSVPLHSSFPQQNEVSFTFHQKIKTRSFYVMMEWKDSILSSSITKQLLE